MASATKSIPAVRGVKSQGLAAKNLTILEDQLKHEALASTKLDQYAQTFTDSGLKSLAKSMAHHHKQHFKVLYQYLQNHQNALQ